MLHLSVSFYFVLGIVGDFDSISKREGRSIAQGITSDNMSSTIMIGMLKPKGTMRPRCKWIYSTSLKRFVCQKDSDSNTILKRQGRSTTFTTNISAGSASGNFYSTVSFFLSNNTTILFYIFFVIFLGSNQKSNTQWFYETKMPVVLFPKFKKICL